MIRYVVMATLACLALHGVAAVPDTDESGRAAVEKWIETRKLISQEKQDWRLGKELLADRARMLEKEIAGVREKISAATNETA